MSIALLVMTDGRDEYLDAAVASARQQLSGNISERWMFDDTGRDAYRGALARRYPDFTHLHGGDRQGFGGALASAWAHLAAQSQATFVFHLEGDFTFDRPVDLGALADVLDERDYLAQMALRRQPCNAAEAAAGGVVEQQPDAYTEVGGDDGRVWLEHRLFWTTNPSLYRASLCTVGWPQGKQSEGRFTYQLLSQGTPQVSGDDVRFGYWGSRASGQWVHHIGAQRVGSGY